MANYRTILITLLQKIPNLCLKFKYSKISLCLKLTFFITLKITDISKIFQKIQFLFKFIKINIKKFNTTSLEHITYFIQLIYKRKLSLVDSYIHWKSNKTIELLQNCCFLLDGAGLPFLHQMPHTFALTIPRNTLVYMDLDLESTNDVKSSFFVTRNYSYTIAIDTCQIKSYVGIRLITKDPDSYEIKSVLINVYSRF